MTKFVRQRLMWRLTALGILVLCLIAVSRDYSDARVANGRQPLPALIQRETPIITPQNQAGTPLVISIARPVPAGNQGPEILFTVSNVSTKTIRAFAIKQDVEVGSSLSTTVSTYNLELTDSELQPNRSLNDFSSIETLSEKQHHVNLSVVYVEFFDGTIWGPDTVNSKERIAGQRAAAMVLSKRLVKALDTSNSTDVASVIDNAASEIEPPLDHSEEWKEGFRVGCQSIVHRLKAIQSKDGPSIVQSEVRKLAQRFKGVQ